MKSKDWLNRQKRDFYVKKAKKQGYLSRAAYKLLEIENKFHFIANSKKILELGAAPGGWSQVALELNPKIEITAIDILDLKINHPQINFYKDDFLNFNYNEKKNYYDLILSDIAPNTTGHQSTDHLSDQPRGNQRKQSVNSFYSVGLFPCGDRSRRLLLSSGPFH